MKTMLLAAVLGLAACGGTEQLFKGDDISAELSNGQPSCSSGVSGPTLHTRTATTTDINGQPFESTIVTCQWACAHSDKFGFTRAFVEAIFYTDQTHVWRMDVLHVDPYPNRVVCPD